MKQATLSVRPDGIVEAYSEEVAFTFDQHKILTIEVCILFVYYRIARNVGGVKFWCPQKNTLAEKTLANHTLLSTQGKILANFTIEMLIFMRMTL